MFLSFLNYLRASFDVRPLFFDLRQKRFAPIPQTHGFLVFYAFWRTPSFYYYRLGWCILYIAGLGAVGRKYRLNYTKPHPSDVDFGDAVGIFLAFRIIPPHPTGWCKNAGWYAPLVNQCLGAIICCRGYRIPIVTLRYISRDSAAFSFARRAIQLDGE